MLVSFHCWKSLKEKLPALAHSFGDFNTKWVGSVAFGPVTLWWEHTEESALLTGPGVLIFPSSTHPLEARMMLSG